MNRILPNSWKWKSLCEVATINYGKSAGAILSDDGEIPVVGTGGVERYGTNYLYDGESIILGRKGTIDRVSFVAGKFWPIDTAYFLSNFHDETNVRWLYYFLQTFDLRSLNEATGVPSLSRELLYKLKVATPSPQEQRTIAEVLSAFDRVIEQTEALIAKQQRIKIGLMQDLLTKGIDEHGNIRSKATHAFKDSPLGRVPVEWQVKLLDDCVRSDAPICYGILMPGSGVDDGVPVIKVRDIFDGAICLNNILLTDPKIDAAYKRSRLRTNDLLITIRGTTGRIALVPPVLAGANITQDTARIRLKDGHLPMFFFYLLQSIDVQRQVDLQTLGQAVKGINIAEVRKLRVPVPPDDEQKVICELLDQSHKAWQASIKYRDKLLLQKAGMMKDLLTGERRVTPLLVRADPQ
jgi:type I restriction enzyme S subunit